MEPIPDKVNKMMDGGDTVMKTVEPTTITAVSVLENEYFYPASNGYKAISIRAATKADADAIYQRRRQPLNPPALEEKVDDKENNQQ